MRHSPPKSQNCCPDGTWNRCKLRSRAKAGRKSPVISKTCSNPKRGLRGVRGSQVALVKILRASSMAFNRHDDERQLQHPFMQQRIRRWVVPPAKRRWGAWVVSQVDRVAVFEGMNTEPYSSEIGIRPTSVSGACSTDCLGH